MVRTQIYLTEEERKGLSKLSRVTGRQQSELIRAAVDSYLEHQSRQSRDTVLRRNAGMWKDRSDLPDFAALREDWDRERAPKK